MTVHPVNFVVAHPLLASFNLATFQAPARELIMTAPHIFTERGHELDNIEKILDSHACTGFELSHGTFMLGMDLADAHWDIMRRENLEAIISFVDRPCATVPLAEKATTDEGKSLLTRYWDIYEAAKTLPGIRNGKLDTSPDVLNILVLRGELNATRGTFTPYAFQNTEGIEDDMQDLWITPLNRNSRMFKEGIYLNPQTNDTSRIEDMPNHRLIMV